MYVNMLASVPFITPPPPGATMLVQINTGHHVDLRHTPAHDLAQAVRAALSRFRGRLTRSDVFLKAERAPAGRTEAIRCVIEARPAGRRPVAVRHRAPSVSLAMAGAAAKLVRLLDATVGPRRTAPRGRRVPV